MGRHRHEMNVVQPKNYVETRAITSVGLLFLGSRSRGEKSGAQVRRQVYIWGLALQQQQHQHPVS